jgi:hypothetical protein
MDSSSEVLKFFSACIGIRYISIWNMHSLLQEYEEIVFEGKLYIWIIFLFLNRTKQL